MDLTSRGTGEDQRTERHKDRLVTHLGTQRLHRQTFHGYLSMECVGLNEVDASN